MGRCSRTARVDTSETAHPGLFQFSNSHYFYPQPVKDTEFATLAPAEEIINPVCVHRRQRGWGWGWGQFQVQTKATLLPGKALVGVGVGWVMNSGHRWGNRVSVPASSRWWPPARLEFKRQPWTGPQLALECPWNPHNVTGSDCKLPARGNTC